MKEHIVSTYDEDLSLLKSNLVEMGLNCEKQLFHAINITRIINIAKANEIITNDDEIDAQETKIRELATITLSKRQPLADDLRKIIISLKISSILSENLCQKGFPLEIYPNINEDDSEKLLKTFFITKR